MLQSACTWRAASVVHCRMQDTYIVRTRSLARRFRLSSWLGDSPRGTRARPSAIAPSFSERLTWFRRSTSSLALSFDEKWSLLDLSLYLGGLRDRHTMGVVSRLQARGGLHGGSVILQAESWEKYGASSIVLSRNADDHVAGTYGRVVWGIFVIMRALVMIYVLC